MSSEQVAEAKRRLPMPALMAQLGHGEAAKKSARCPFHVDSSASFSMYQRADGLWAWKCHAGCGGGDEPDFLARARNLSPSDACREFIKLAGVHDSPAINSGENPRRIATTYDYRDEAGALLFQVVRFEPKTFRQRRPDSAAPDGWTWKLDGVRRVLYRLPEILVALKEGGTIVLAEGEKDVAALVKHGFAATCNAGGAGKWLDDYTATLRGAEVVIVADKDDAGRSHAQLVAGKLNGSAKSVRVVELPDFNAQPVKDAHDFFAVGATADDFRAILTAAPSVAAPTDSERLDPKPDLRTAPPKIASKSVITLSEEPDEPERAPFPMDCLPATLVGLASGVARTARVPERLTGVCALGLVSAAIGAGLEVQSDPQRTTRGNLFLLVSAETGTGKSRTFELLAAPLLDHQEKLQERWRKESAPRIQSNFKILERELANLEKKAARATDPSERERLRAEHEYKTAEKNQLATCNIQPLLLVQDATTERLTAMMEEHGEVLFSASSDSRRDHVSSGSQEHIALILLRGGQFSPLLPAVGGSHCFSRMVPTFRAPPLTVGRRAFSGHPCGTLKHFETVSGAKIEVGGRTVQLPKTRPHGESDSAGIPEPLRSFSPVIVAPAPFLISPRSKRNEHPRDSAC